MAGLAEASLVGPNTRLTLFSNGLDKGRLENAYVVPSTTEGLLSLLTAHGLDFVRILYLKESALRLKLLLLVCECGSTAVIAQRSQVLLHHLRVHFVLLSVGGLDS